MSTRVAFNAQNGVGKSVADFVAEFQITLAKGRRLKSILDSMSSASDWSSVEAGIGGMTAGQGQVLWTIVSTAMVHIDSAQTAELARLDQG